MIFAPLNKKKKFIGDILIDEGVITRDQLNDAIQEQEKTGETLKDTLINLEYISEEKYMKALAVQNDLVFKKLAHVEFNEDLRDLIPVKMARDFNIVPILFESDVLTVAMNDPSNVVIIDEIKTKVKKRINIVVSSQKDIENFIEKLYCGLAGFTGLSGDEEVEEVTVEDEKSLLPEGEFGAEDAPIVKYVNSVIHEAVSKTASDIHLEPMEDEISLRMRKDGKLQVFPGPAKKSYSAIISRIKIMANLDIAERRLPQDGKCMVKVSGNKVDIRVSTMPTIYGEKMVLRILQRTNISLDMDEIGFTKEDQHKYVESLEKPYGMILVTGPTGSGKTTTLYSGLNYINEPERNIITIEDPIEYELKKINQVQVKPVIGLDFAQVLRRVLRQDPDVIMVGEIRDQETAEIAVQSALTGHLVMSTLHTNDAVGTLSRLKFMGIESYLVADAVQLVMAQRLVRKICPNCKQEQKVPANILKKLGISAEEKTKFYEGRGCDDCFNTGYNGRIAVYEICPISSKIRELIMTDTNDIEIKKKAIEEGMKTLRVSALERLRDGQTTIEEVHTVTFA